MAVVGDGILAFAASAAVDAADTLEQVGPIHCSLDAFAAVLALRPDYVVVCEPPSTWWATSLREAVRDVDDPPSSRFVVLHATSLVALDPLTETEHAELAVL